MSAIGVVGQFMGDPEEVPNPNSEMAFQETAMSQPMIDLDTAAIAERIFNRMAERAPGWVAHDANLEVWLIEEFSAVAAEIRQEAVRVPEAIFQTYGEEVLGIPMTIPLPALGTSTWTAQDDRGYTIPVNTQITVARSGDDLIVFETNAEARIPVGSRTIEGVQIRAQVPGANANALSGPADVVDPLFWVESVEVPLPTVSGTDGQTLDEYLTELIMLLRVIALRPILPWDFAVLALRVPGVVRAVAMDGYRLTPGAVAQSENAIEARASLVTWLNSYGRDPALREQRSLVTNLIATLSPDESGGTWGHQRTVSLIVTDAYGDPLPQATKDAIRDLLESLREVNWRVYVLDPDYEVIDVEYECTAFAEQDIEVVEELCTQAIRDFLAPANFRLGTTSPAIVAGEVIPPPPQVDGEFMPGRQTLRINDLIGLLDRQRGVDWVNEGTVTMNGTTSDLPLPGPTTLPRPGEITGVVHPQ
jgi:Baseplate J-like protein